MRTPIKVAALAWAGVLTIGAGAVAQSAFVQPNSARECAICHLEWIETPQRAGAVILLSVSEPKAGDERTCLGCHDGSVADSRVDVWGEHGHKTGVALPEGLKPPDGLPLADGKVACRTCHAGHTNPGPSTLATAVGLRMPNPLSELCQMCHPDKTKGPELGTHPVGGMPFPVPAELLAAGARSDPESRRLICETCHRPHGSGQDHLLVMGTQSSQLCLTCHAQLRPGLWRPETEREHPQNPPLSSDAQRRAISEMKTTTGPGETLICISCHKLHHGLVGRYMLADTLSDSQLCLRCHPGRESLWGTSHDLRASTPTERNRLGQTSDESGPCGTCHSFHQFARQPTPQKLDPAGLCMTCHDVGQCAAGTDGLSFSHPGDIEPEEGTAPIKLTLYPDKDKPERRVLACLTCHEPHETGHPEFLRASSDELCATCHGDRMANLAAEHDFRSRPELKNGRGLTAVDAGRCGFCHAVHNALGPAMWAATKERPRGANDLCLQCHRSGGIAAERLPPELRHPTGPATAGKTVAADAARHIPLFSEDGRRSADGQVACASCHELHGGPASEPWLRQTAPGGPESLCGQCHEQARSVECSGHRRETLSTYFEDTGLCAPCHVSHARPGMGPAGMWAAPLGSPADGCGVRQCTGCHSPTGPAMPVDSLRHPAVLLQQVDLPETPGLLPLFDHQCQVATTGEIACASCHWAHGRTPEASSADIQPVGPVCPDPPAASKSMIRPYQAPNVCTSCHGYDGLRRYLYYHEPARRGALFAENQP